MRTTNSKEPLSLQPRAEVIGAAIVNLLMGIWLLGAPYALGYDRTAAAWNSTIVGILVMAVAVVRLMRPTTTAWLSAVTLALGVWLVAASFVLNPVMTARTVNNLISAAVIMTEAGVSLVYGLRAVPGGPAPATGRRVARAASTLAGVKAAFGVCVTLLLLIASPAFAGAPNGTDQENASAVLAQASPSPSRATETPTASPSPGEEGNEGGLTTGAGIVIAAILIGGLLLMRTRLLRG